MLDIFTKPFASWTLIDLLLLSPIVALLSLIRGFYTRWWLGRQGLDQWPTRMVDSTENGCNQSAAMKFWDRITTPGLLRKNSTENRG